MNLDIELIFTLLISILSLLTAVLGGLLIFQIINNKKSYIQNKLLVVFGLLALSFILEAIAENIWTILSFLGINPAFGVAEYFYIAGYIFSIISLIYFTKICIKDSKLKELIPLILFGVLLLGVTIFSLKYFLNFLKELSLFEGIVAYFYPIFSGLMVVLSASIYSFFKKVGNLGKPLFLIALGFLFCYIGDLTYTFYSFREIYGGLGILSDSTYLLQYIFTSIAFYILYSQLKKKEIKK